jgi:flagellar hook protein FlgE
MGFQQGLSGLNATSKNLEVIGNNIANANTYGAKVSRAEFADMYANSLSGGSTSHIGIGTQVAAVAQQFTQGNISTTGNAMDLAINGAGFFQLTDGASPPQYSRNGQFKVDRDGWIVNNGQLKLMGYPADGAGVIQPGTAKPLQLPTAGIAPNATTKVGLELNLDSRAATTYPGAAAVPQIDFDDPSSYNNATSLTVYDVKGQDLALTYYFQKAGTDSWNVYVTANGAPVNGAPGNPQAMTTMNFLADGSAPAANLSALPVSIAGPITNSAGASLVTPLDFDMSLAGATQYGSNFGITSIGQDGYAPGQLTSIAMEGNGIVMARYSNGQTKPAGQLELANFRNPQGLQPNGNNVWGSTYASGSPVVGTPGQGNMGVLQAGALEDSNVDLTGELVNMITAQRIYQANAQTIKTEDQVLQTLVNLR